MVNCKSDVLSWGARSECVSEAFRTHLEGGLGSLLYQFQIELLQAPGSCLPGSEDNQVMRGSSEAALAVLICALNSFSSGDGSSGFLLGLRAGRAFSWEEDTAPVHFCPGIQLSCSRRHRFLIPPVPDFVFQ